jgi:hypothetical protein
VVILEKKILILAFTLFIFFFSILNTNNLHAAPVCGGTFSCNRIQNTCLWSNGGGICPQGATDPILGTCFCQMSCAGGTDGPWNCSGSSCPDQSILCSELCGLASYGCFQQNDACTVDSQCGANSRCCNGGSGPNTCTSTCYDCAGNYICAAPTATPPPAPTATPPPTVCTVTTTYCGSACVGCGVTSDNYLDTCGNCVQTAQYTGNWCGAPCGPTSTPAAPTPTTGGSTPVPTVPVGCGSGSLCGSTCCGATDVCMSPDVCVPTVGGCLFGVNPHSTCQNFACTPTNSCGISNCSTNNDCTCGDNICQSHESTSTCPSDCSNTLDGRVFIDSDNNGVYQTADTVCPVSSSTFNPTTVSDCTFSGYSVCGNFSGATSLCYDDNGSSGLTSSDEFCPPNLTIAQCQANGFNVCSAGPYGCFDDNNSNGTYQSTGDTGISNPTLSLVPNNYGNLSTTATGRYTFSTVPIGNHTLTLSVPAGYVTSVTNPVILPMIADTTYNFPLTIAPTPPICVPGSISQAPSGTVDPGESVTLSVTSCGGIPTPTPTPPPGSTPTPTPTTGAGPTPTPTSPPFDWNPPTGPTPQCSDSADNDSDGTIDTLDPGCHTDGDPTNPGTYEPGDDSETNPSNTCQDAGTSTPTNTSTSSTITWTAPSCPSVQLICQPQVVLTSATGGLTTTYTTNITVPATYTITTNVRSVPDATSCLPTSGTGYSGANINTTNGSTVNTNQTTNISGVSTFSCLPNGNYQVTVSPPSGYSVVGTNGGTSTTSNTINITPLNGNSTLTYCIAPINPWFQTDFGDVRYSSLINPIPPDEFGSSDANFPGIFYSSESVTSPFGVGTVSPRGWFINGEFNYNSDTENRNGGMSYDFYKSKASFDQEDIVGTGVYEVRGIEDGGSGNLTISDYNPQPGQRIVILVPGNVIIDDNEIEIGVGTGLFILAVKGNITISEGVGTPDPINATTLAQTTTQLDGYYTAQGSIVLESRGNSCADGTTSDRRLNIGGALVANSLKPFSTSGIGTVQNNRSLCLENLNNPSLYVTSRPDFLTQMTDFYKISYSKWSEINP